MENTFLKSSCFILLVVVAFVYFANPIYAKASTADMDYIETDMSTSEVKALFSGAAAFIPAAFVIIGFIALMYCTLRNVNTPVQFSSSDTFIDKCRSLGHYCVDNCTDSLKNVLYSVYEYCEDNNITSITGFGTFLALNIGKFITAFSSWINGSLISNVSSVGNGLLNQFVNGISLNYTVEYSYIDQFIPVYNSYSTIPYSSTIGTFAGNYWGNENSYYQAYSITSVSPVILVYSTNTFVRIYAYTLDSSLTNIVPSTFSYKTSSFKYSSSNRGNVSPNLSSYNSVNWVESSGSYIEIGSGGNIDYYPLDLNHIVSYLNLFVSRGVKIATVSSYPASSIPIDSLSWVNTVEDVINPSVDNVYVPQAPAIPIDLVGTWSDLADALAHGGDAADVTQEDKIAAYVPADVALQLDSAVSDTMNVIGGGNYVFPSLKGVWKYAEYFFNTLKGWGQFVGGCLNAVTVGEGGLSWLFYGGFIILVCGGVVGKILLG